MNTDALIVINNKLWLATFNVGQYLKIGQLNIEQDTKIKKGQ